MLYGLVSLFHRGLFVPQGGWGEGKKDAGVDLVPRAITYIFFHFHLKYRWEPLCRRERIDNYEGDQKFAGISEGCWHPRGVARGGP